ncbi:MAG: tRNA adenosine(34) deaminase TadA [Neisseriaceae bacterium]|nr:tRNA adenosine(34) deaminase TadA [Neisseriaceae bacterium]
MSDKLASYGILPPNILKKLKQLGIECQEDLVNEGSLTAFLKIKSIHLGLTQSILWKLYAIEKNIPYQNISQESKRKVLQEIKKHPIVKNFPTKEEMEKFMQLAILEAKKSLLDDEVPVGAVVVQNGEIIGRGYNQCIKGYNIANHAEMLAIKVASEKIKNYRLDDCDLYVTLEPCMMCTGAIIQSRISRVVYGTKEAKTGMIESFDSSSYRYMNHHTAFKGGILEQECKQLLVDFFSSKRI